MQLYSCRSAVSCFSTYILHQVPRKSLTVRPHPYGCSCVVAIAVHACTRRGAITKQWAHGVRHERAASLRHQAARPLRDRYCQHAAQSLVVWTSRSSTHPHTRQSQSNRASTLCSGSTRACIYIIYYIYADFTADFTRNFYSADFPLTGSTQFQV